MNLLDMTNRVLSNVGERTVETTQNFPRPGVVGKAVNSLTTALVQVTALKDWSWLRFKRQADLWQNPSTAVIERLQVLFNVYDNDCIVPYIKPEDDWLCREGYTVYRKGTQVFNYEPLDTDLVLFDCTIHPTMPEEDADELDIPYEHTELLILRASVNMALAHNAEPSIVQLYTGQFEQLGQMLRSKDLTMQNDSINFLGGYRRGHTWH